MRAMLCGASDLKNLVPMFEKAAYEIGITPLNYMSGKINYHNYGHNKWIENSKATVNDVDIIVFVINESHGAITWNTEYNEALTNGKNFIVMCLRDTYQNYRYVKKLPSLPEGLPQDDKLLFEQLDLLESMNQITIVQFQVSDFETKVKEQIVHLLKYGLSLTEKYNQKSTFIPILKSSSYRSNIEQYKNPLYENIARDILFDFFETKELRKRALDYFTVTKSLTTEEIISLFTDVEDGISRKTMALLESLLNDEHDLHMIVASAVESSSEGEVGFVRRLIAAAFDVSPPIAIKCLPGLFPCQDIGTPRRIINQISQRFDSIKQNIAASALKKEEVIRLIDLCLNYKSEQGWKDVGNSLLSELTSV